MNCYTCQAENDLDCESRCWKCGSRLSRDAQERVPRSKRKLQPKKVCPIQFKLEHDGTITVSENPEAANSAKPNPKIE